MSKRLLRVTLSKDESEALQRVIDFILRTFSVMPTTMRDDLTILQDRIDAAYEYEEQEGEG